MDDKSQKPNQSRRQKKEQKEQLSIIENIIKITPEEFESRIQSGIEKERKKLKWKNIDAATKLSAFLTLMLVLTALSALLFQWQANKTTRENLKIIQQEFELNSRPYISIESTNYYKKKDTLDLIFKVKNYGSIPGQIELTKIPIFKKPFKLNFEPYIEKTTIYPNHSLDFHQILKEKNPLILEKLQIKISYVSIYSPLKKFESNLIYEVDHSKQILKLISSIGN